MKTFNLEKALAGEFVKLRNGNKALITYCVPEKYKYADGSSSHYPLQGIMFDKFDNVLNTYTMWRINGMHTYYEHPYDIISMWEELKLTTEEIMEKALQKGLTVKHKVMPDDYAEFKVIAKTTFNDYVLQNTKYGINVYLLSNFPERIQWELEE